MTSTRADCPGKCCAAVKDELDFYNWDHFEAHQYASHVNEAESRSACGQVVTRPAASDSDIKGCGSVGSETLFRRLVLSAVITSAIAAQTKDSIDVQL
jgi:hypothetical protein